MKFILATIVGLATSAAFAQMPTTDAMKAKAGAAADATAGKVEAAKTAATDMKEKAMVNLNTAPAEDLAKLPGIGTERAQAIIEGRPYKKLSDLKKVKGIKEGVVAKLKGLVSFN